MAPELLKIGDDGLVQGRNPRPIPFGAPTVAQILDDRFGPKTALIDSAGELSFAGLEMALDAATTALETLGLRAGDRLAASCQNHNAMIVAFLAAQRLGILWVGINRALAPPEKCVQLNDSGARILLADPITAEQVGAQLSQLPRLERICATGAEPATEWPALIARNIGKRVLRPTIDPFAPAVISYTSGTTGIPKGVVHSQHSIMTFVNGGLYSGRGGIWEPGLRRTVTIPLTIFNGMTYGPLTALASGGSFVSMDRVDAAGVAEWIGRAAIQILCCTPPTIRDILLNPELQDCDVASLRFVLAGGAAGAADLRSSFRDRIGSELIDEYGFTEAPSGVAGSRGDIPPRAGVTGEAYPHLEIAALDGNAQPLPIGEVGTIGVRAVREGPWAHVFTGMLGYWNQPSETAAAFRNGWLCTGDLGRVDEHNNVAIVGRSKEIILRGGANIYPMEIERVLRAIAGVEDAIVVGLPDERLGEVVGAFIKLQDHTIQRADLADHLATACEGELARYKIPERWYLVEEIPRNAMNKPDRPRLREGPKRELYKSGK
jgi:long-chain acyl-CoA synthetase